MSWLTLPAPAAPHPRDVLALLKPITWFPPMWAFLCGVVSSGVPLSSRWGFLLAGVLLAGPLVCGTSQAVNDWYDRHVDAINEPDRPIPSGRVGGQWGLWIAVTGSLLSALVAWVIGPWVFAATLLGLFFAWAYSAPPLRLKMSGWWGPGAVALSYEGLTWFTGAAVMAGGLPDGRILALLLLYSAGAHGIMTLNDFKAVAGDAAMGIRSLPVILGEGRAARLACAVMLLPQLAVVALLLRWGLPWHGGAVALLIGCQVLAMRRLLRDPARFAPWYGGAGVGPYVLGMLVSAFGIGSLLGSGA
ncbi:chlorophyll synthase ChlG [Sandaracinobacteroides saxicola]|uniref:Chlorophyll synthase ChlG n=1 Tax=Sandaracinobacteroides saxicola TaxID=2759707 RepID=A0A7G5IKU3_9SPHN|nr:chlorophyll synthase ChlG [Sandaracinobacteroides saxicola]QMW23985.1 chlorophyll synthase ChlG [Sandaracinobacteroides saxicola]